MTNNPSLLRLPVMGRFGAMIKLAITAGMFAFTILASRGSIIFSENMGTPSSTTSIAANTFENAGTLTFSGTGDVRNTIVSSGYTDASAGGNVFLTTTAGRNFQIASINTVGYSSLVLSFGAFKSSITSDMSGLVFDYSTDGISYTTVSIPSQPTGPGTADWRLISNLSLGSDAAGVSNLRLRWTQAGTPTSAFRLDDIMLEGTEVVIAAVPEPSTYIAGALLLLPFGVHGFRYFRNRKLT